MIDLAIIGGGPAGYVAAAKAGANNMQVVLFEQRALGGTCLNEGCIPTKTLLYGAKVYDYTKHADKYGVKVAESSFDYGKMVSRKNKVVRKLCLGIGAKMKNNNVQVVTGTAHIDGKNGELFAISCNGEVYEAKNLLICSGSEAFVPPIPGLKEAGDVIVTNREILQLKELPKSLVIIGGGVIGMEFASLYNSLGAEVTVIEMLPKILGPMDSEISSMLMDVYAKRGIKFNLNCKVTEIKGNSVIYTTQDGETMSVEGEKILVSVGRRANTAGLGVENIGVEMNRGAIRTDDHLRTNIANVYAAGDVNGVSLLAHTASSEAVVAVNNMLGIEDTMSYKAIPGVVYTNPEVAGVGLTQDAADQQGVEYNLCKLEMTHSGRFVAENEGGNGICKVLTDKQGVILGVTMLGNPCSEMIYGAGMAVESGMTVEQLKKFVFPHPTVSEILKETIN